MGYSEEETNFTDLLLLDRSTPHGRGSLLTYVHLLPAAACAHAGLGLTLGSQCSLTGCVGNVNVFAD